MQVLGVKICGKNFKSFLCQNHKIRLIILHIRTNSRRKNKDGIFFINFCVYLVFYNRLIDIKISRKTLSRKKTFPYPKILTCSRKSFLRSSDIKIFRCIFYGSEYHKKSSKSKSQQEFYHRKDDKNDSVVVNDKPRRDPQNSTEIRKKN